MINCAVCGSRNIIFFNRFADYPLTNLYLDVPSKDEKYKANLEVYQCHCGHIQANSFFDSKNIYTTDYPYNGSASGVVARRDKGVSLIKKNVTCNRLNTIVDIGCGQLEMINLVRKQFSANRIIGLDPVPLRMNLDDLGDIEFYNEYFTGANFRLSVGDGPNLFMLDNVLEHVPDPNSFLSNLNDCTALGDFIYVCVPSCESMLMKLQFQELIHEHVHYFSIPILNELLGRHGFKSVESCCDATGSRGYNYILYVKSHDSRNEG